MQVEGQRIDGSNRRSIYSMAEARAMAEKIPGILTFSSFFLGALRAGSMTSFDCYRRLLKEALMAVGEVGPYFMCVCVCVSFLVSLTVTIFFEGRQR